MWLGFQLPVLEAIVVIRLLLYAVLLGSAMAVSVQGFASGGVNVVFRDHCQWQLGDAV